MKTDTPTYAMLADMRDRALIAERELTAVTEQRDGLHELHNKNAARSKELLELCGTLRIELTAMTEQRDRLAEALRMITTFDYSDLQCDNGHGARYVATDALQSLTPKP